MRKYIYLIILVSCVSCEKILDKQPLDSISGSSFWRSAEDADAGLVACYDALQGRNRAGNFSYELMGLFDCLTPIGNSREVGYANLANGTADARNAQVKALWSSAYRGIVRCNDFLDHINNIIFSENRVAEKSRMIAEAKFLRALFYFQLIDQFGDIPMILHVQTLDEAKVSRTPKKLVIDSMMVDINYAINNLQSSYPKSSTGRATIGAAKTLKLKYQMLLKDFAGAAITSKEVMEMSYSLQTSFPNIFSITNENNSEVIFDIQFISLVGDGNAFDKLYGNRSASGDGWSWIQPTLWLVDKYEVIDSNPAFTIEDPKIPVDIYKYFEGRDPRMDWTIVRPGKYFINKTGQPVLYPYKLVNYAHSLTGMHLRKNVIEGIGGVSYDSPSNWIIFRLADVILLYAEAKTQSAHAAGTLVTDPSIYKAINDIRKRASTKLPLYSIGSLTKEQMLDKIYDERIRELAFEGWLYSDFKRWNWLDKNAGFEVKGLNITPTTIKFNPAPLVIRNFTPNMYLFPIPQSEIDVNSSLTQNQGW